MTRDPDGRSGGPASPISGEGRSRELAKLERIRASMHTPSATTAPRDDLAAALDEWISRSAGGNGTSPSDADMELVRQNIRERIGEERRQAEDPVERARRERRERREARRLHREAVDRAARGPAMSAAQQAIGDETRDEQATWDLMVGLPVTRLQVLRSASKRDTWCRVTYRPGGTSLGWGPCGKARCPKCIARVMTREIAELLAELSQHGEHAAIVMRFADRAEAHRFRRSRGIRIKGRTKTPGVRQFEVGFDRGVALIVPAALFPGEPGARTGEHLGRALFSVYSQRVETIPEPKDDDDGQERRPRLRHDVRPETVETIARQRGMTFDVEHHGKAWTFLYFYDCEPEDVDGLVEAANAAAPDDIGNLALARAGP